MKMISYLPLLLTTTLLSLTGFTSQAQDNSPPTANFAGVNADSLTNGPTMQELMTSNNVVTNTVKLVLVKISPGFWAGKYEVTQDAYQKVMHQNPSAFSGGNRPVDSVTWSNAMTFCSTLTDQETEAKELPKGYRYTLPTEDQWQTLMADASLKDAVMKLNGAVASTAPVGSLGANSLGLYDTRGNVMEWCLDSQNPAAYHVLHGGGWDTFLEVNARPEFREYAGLDVTKNDYGFRVILTGPADIKP